MAAAEVRSRTATDVNVRAPDPRAVAVISMLQSRVPDTQDVVLFGSRAMGNWRPESDIDIAVIGMSGDRDSELALHQQAAAIAKAQYGPFPPYVQIFPFRRPEFEELRTSHPHMAGQVQYWGIDASGEPLPRMSQDNPWPAAQAHLQSSHNDLANALFNVGGGMPQLAVALRSAHGALENCLKALLSAARVDFRHHHKLATLASQVPDVYRVQAGGFPDTAWLEALTKFREQSPYAGNNPPWPAESTTGIVGKVQRLCGSLAQSTLVLMNKHPTDVGYETLHDREGSLGGLELLPLDHFSPRESMEQFGAVQRQEGEREGELKGAVANALEYMEKLPLSARVRLRDAWLEAGAVPHAQKVMAVLLEQAEWQTLLPEGHRDEGDDASQSLSE